MSGDHASPSLIIVGHMARVIPPRGLHNRGVLSRFTLVMNISDGDHTTIRMENQRGH